MKTANTDPQRVEMPSALEVVASLALAVAFAVVPYFLEHI